MKCKQCGTRENVVRYGTGLTYKLGLIPSGPHCHDCIRAFKEYVDRFSGDAEAPPVAESATTEEVDDAG
jgi:hypothetical protein